jgi:alcohol dehydrogenase (NADP+)
MSSSESLQDSLISVDQESTDPGKESIQYKDVLCMACEDNKCDFKATKLKRRVPTDYDVVIKMHYCGVCHSDIHTAAGHLDGIAGASEYPMVPGHELAGIVSEIGSKVTKFKVGMKIGVGCMVDSCGSCASCAKGWEHKCKKQVGTYNSDDKSNRNLNVPVRSKTLGGYTDLFIVHENFGVSIPDSYPLEYAGPVMCAGVTMYDPMQAHGVKAGDTIGIVGLGGLGQMGVKIAKALGCKVTVISRGMSKEAFAKKCGADSYIASSSVENMTQNKGTIDLILNTIPTYHDYTAYQPLLKKTGKQVLLGLHKGMFAGFVVGKLVNSRIVSSVIGGMKATQDVINLCAANDIKPEISIVPVSQLNKIYEMLDSGADNGTRYVLDIKTMKTGTVCTEPPPKLQDMHLPTKGGTLWEICSLLASFWWW